MLLFDIEFCVFQMNRSSESMFWLVIDFALFPVCSRRAGPLSEWSPQQRGRTGSSRTVPEAVTTLCPSVCQRQQSGVSSGHHKVGAQLCLRTCLCVTSVCWPHLFSPWNRNLSKSFASFEGLCFGLGLRNEQRGNKVVTRCRICVHGHTCLHFF